MWSPLERNPLIVFKKGKPLAALISVENADWETVSLSTNKKFMAMIEKSRRRLKKEGGLSPEEMRRRLESKKRA